MIKIFKHGLRLTLFFLPVAFALMGCGKVYESEGTEGNFKYAYSEEDAFIYEYVWDGTEEGMTIEIPDSIGGKPVTAIGGYYGRGLPMDFQVNIKEAIAPEGDNWATQIYEPNTINETIVLEFVVIKSPAEEDEVAYESSYYKKVEDGVYTEYKVKIEMQEP